MWEFLGLCVVARWHIQMIMRAMKSMKSMKMPAVRKTPAKRATKSMKAKKKPAVRMKPAMRAMRDGWKWKDDQIVELRIQIAVVWEKVDRLLEEVLKWRTEAEVAKAKLATVEEEKKKQVAIVPDTGELWVKAGRA